MVSILLQVVQTLRHALTALPLGALRASLASSASLRTGQAPASRAKLLPTRPLRSLRAQQAMLPPPGIQGAVAAASPAAAGAAVAAATPTAVSCAWDCCVLVAGVCIGDSLSSAPVQLCLQAATSSVAVPLPVSHLDPWPLRQLEVMASVAQSLCEKQTN